MNKIIERLQWAIVLRPWEAVAVAMIAGGLLVFTGFVLAGLLMGAAS